MIKIMPGISGNFHNFKCGEVFCLSSEEYKITCCLCGSEVELEDFPTHFQAKHLSDGCTEKDISPTTSRGKNASVVNKSQETQRSSKSNNEVHIDIKREMSHEDLEEVSAFSWADHFQDDDEVPIDMPPAPPVLRPSIENVIIEHANANSFEKDLNTLLDIGDQGAKVEVFGGDEDDDIDIGVENDEWLHEKYSYANVPSDDDDSAEVDDTPIVNIKVDMYERNNDYDDDDDPMDTTASTSLANSAKCEYCDRTFYSEVGLKIHIKAVHDSKGRRAKKEKKSVSPTPIYQCDDCGDKFTTERQLRFHRYKHTGIICEVCGKTFTQIGNLERHKIRHTGVKSLQCVECDKTFFTDKELNAHMIRHTGIHPHICEVCGKQCRDRGVLTAHMRRHTGERPAKCKVCGKSFFCGYDLNVHSVTHTTERPFKCDICGSTFQLKKSLRVHKKIHNKNRDHICKVCGKGFAQSSGLNAHMRMHDPANTSSTLGDISKLYEPNDSVDNEIVDVAVIASNSAIADLSIGQQGGTQWNGLEIL